jgi:hypothetical protein
MISCPFQFRRLATAAVLALSSSIASATTNVIEIESLYLREGTIPWLGSDTFGALLDFTFEGYNRERPFFDALGTLQDTTGQIFVRSEVRMSFICGTPGQCGTTVSELRFTRRPDGDVVGTPTVTLKESTGFVATNYPPPAVGFDTSFRRDALVRSANDAWSVDGPLLEPMRATHVLTLGNGWSVLGQPSDFKYTMELEVRQSYVPHTVGRYVTDAIAASRATGRVVGSLATSDAAAGYLKALRGTNAETASLNYNLRDAEYAFLGYASGLALKSRLTFTWGEDGRAPGELGTFERSPLFQGPVGARAHGIWKQLALRSLGRPEEPAARAAALLWAAAYGGSAPGQTSPLPPTTDRFGGVEANRRAWWHGRNGGDLDALADCLEGGLCAEPPAGASGLRGFGGFSVLSSPVVVTPIAQDTTALGGVPVTVSLYEIQASDSGVLELALPLGDSHVLDIIGRSFGSVLWLGPLEGVANAGIAWTTGNDVDLASFAGGSFSFLDASLVDVTAFTLFGVDLGALTGQAAALRLELIGEGFASMEVASITAVPEPSAALLMALGVGSVVLTARAQRVRRHKSRHAHAPQ